MRASIRRWYADPAVVEAVFEIRAVAAAPWDPEMYQRMAARFPGFDGAEHWLSPDAPVSRYRASFGEDLPDDDADGRRVYRATPEGTRAVQVGPGVCAYHVRKPYGHYEDHVTQLQRLFEAYLAEERPMLVGHAEQRYINEFRISRNERPSALFSFYPPLPEELQRRHTDLRVEVGMLVFEGGATTIILSRVATDATHVVYHLEVVARSTHALAADTDVLTRWHNLAHSSVDESFELAITAECRKRLRQV
jgi:uncharacterized protein (TIGR04255 family)